MAWSLWFCFYLVSTGTVTNTNQFFPLFTASIDSVASKQNYSLTLNEELPLINHPVVQAGTNFTSANNEVAPKQRGLMLKRGQALYVAASGATALSVGFFCKILKNEREVFFKTQHRKSYDNHNCLVS